MAKKKKGKKKESRQDRLVAAAGELNEVMGLDPAIDVELDEEELEEAIKAEGDSIQPDDEYSEATLKVLKELDITAPEDLEPGGEGEEPEEEEEGKDEEPEGDDEEPEGEEGEEEDEEPADKPAKKDKKPKKPPKKAEEARYTRVNAFAEALQSKQKTNEEALLKKADGLFVQHGGDSNDKETQYMQRRGLAILEALELIEVKDGKITRKF